MFSNVMQQNDGNHTMDSINHMKKIHFISLTAPHEIKRLNINFHMLKRT